MPVQSVSQFTVPMQSVSQFTVHAMNSVQQAEIQLCVCSGNSSRHGACGQPDGSSWLFSVALTVSTVTDVPTTAGCDATRRAVSLSSTIAHCNSNNNSTCPADSQQHCILQHDCVCSEVIIIIKIKWQSRFSVQSAITSQFSLLIVSRNRPTCTW